MRDSDLVYSRRFRNPKSAIAHSDIVPALLFIDVLHAQLLQLRPQAIKIET